MRHYESNIKLTTLRLTLILLCNSQVGQITL
nr:MAG TPA: hypothetical protein [Caudoviricetes sp.]